MSITRNTAYTIAGTALPLLVNIVAVPMMITAVGTERYGALLLAWILLGYFGQADFGIGRAITQRLAATNNGSRERQADSVWAALASTTVFSAIAGLLLYIAGSIFFGRIFQVGPELRGELVNSLWMLGLCTPVVAISGVLSGALQGLNRFGLSSAGTLVSSMGMQVFPLVAAYAIAPRLDVLIAASLVARVMAIIIPGIGVWRWILRGQRVRPTRSELASLAGFGAWIMVTAIISPLMVSSDRFVIGAFAGASAVAAYAIPFQIAARTTILPISVSQALFPRFAAADLAESRDRCAQAIVFVGQIYAPVCVALACLAAPLLHLWLGAALDTRSILIGQIVLAGFWANAVANVPYAFIQARGDPRFTAILHILELPFYLILLFGLGSQWGLAGFAAAYAVRCAIDCAVLMAKAGVATRPVICALAGPGVLVLASLVVGQTFQKWLPALIATALMGTAGAAFALVQMPPLVRAQLLGLPLVRRFAPHA